MDISPYICYYDKNDSAVDRAPVLVLPAVQAADRHFFPSNLQLEPL